MAHGWTDARKAKQRKAVYRWRLWEKSTGPRTPAGKARVSKNALKHGMRSREVIEELQAMRRLLREWAD